MSSTEPDAGNQLPLPLDPDEAPRSTVIPIGATWSGAAQRAGRAPAAAARGLEPARPPLTDAEIAHRRAMLEHLTRQSA